MSLGPKVRLRYMSKYVPDAKMPKALLVGVVNDDEYRVICGKGYEVVKADLNPRHSSIMKFDLTCPPAEMFGSMDLVVASDVLEHINDDRAALKGVYDLLAPGGLAYIHTPGGDMNSPLDSVDREHGHVRHGYSEEQIRGLIATQPFGKVIYLKTFNEIERKACMTYQGGNKKLAEDMLVASTLNGKEGRSHLFLLIK